MHDRVKKNADFAVDKLSKAATGPKTRSVSVVRQARILFDGCPLCGSRNVEHLCTADCSNHSLYQPIIDPAMRWLRCNSCSHVYTDGYFSAETRTSIFERTHENQEPGWDFEAQRRVSARMVERVAQYGVSGRWLDVGFGNGSLLLTAEEWGFIPVGLDLRKSSVDSMNKLGIEAHCIEMNALEGDESFSVISMADVLEHMPFPGEALRTAHRLLSSNGLLFVSTPNYNCAVWRLLDAQNRNPYWGELEHFHNFSRARFYALLRESGFEPSHYHISERYRVCMEIIAKRIGT
jgi:SAM-dependent methyltransferase